MELPITERYIKKGIQMQRPINHSFFGTTYDYKNVYDLEEAIVLNNEGWWFSKSTELVLGNLALNLYRDIKADAIKKPKKK